MLATAARCSMAHQDENDDLDAIMSQVLKFPDKEFYPGFFDEVRQVKEQLAARAERRNRQRPGGLWQARADLSLKAHLIQQWRRRQRQLEPLQQNQANDNSRTE